jgi:hypothetical protein
MKLNTTPLLALALITAFGAAACSERKGITRPAAQKKDAALKSGTGPQAATTPQKSVEPSKVADEADPKDAADRYARAEAMVESIRVSLKSEDEWKDAVFQLALGEFINASESLLSADRNGVFVKEDGRKMLEQGVEAARKRMTGKIAEDSLAKLEGRLLGLATQLMDLVQSKEPLSPAEQKTLVRTGKTLLALDFALSLYGDEYHPKGNVGYLGMMDKSTRTREGLQHVVAEVEGNLK